ncbi:transposase [Streptomyces sp. NPDC057963]|uniref:transposase n=1 Tax=Streptomyces sp. NPDC057963 TaxID=3346290 RepID=UPI0036E51B2A
MTRSEALWLRCTARTEVQRRAKGCPVGPWRACDDSYGTSPHSVCGSLLVADAGYGANADFRHGLEDRGPAYALQAKGEMTTHAESAEPHRPACGGLGSRPPPRYRNRPVSLCEHVLAAGRDKAVSVTRRKGSRTAMTSRFEWRWRIEHGYRELKTTLTTASVRAGNS